MRLSWRARSWLLRVLSKGAVGQAVYQQLQRRFGEFRQPAIVENRLKRQAELARRAVSSGVRLEGATVVEVGTGWVPLVPFGFWVCGAARVITVDANRFLQYPMVSDALNWIDGHQERLASIWEGLAPEAAIRDRLKTLTSLKDRPGRALKATAIEYRAPADARSLDLPDRSVDLHCSTFVFEHVPPEAIAAILREAGRVLKSDGVAVHHIDPSDHFAHVDSSISRVNFLRFDDGEWERIAGNRLAYLNRLRDDDYERLFEAAELDIAGHEFIVESRSLAALEGGLSLAERFRNRSLDLLARGSLTFTARTRS